MGRPSVRDFKALNERFALPRQSRSQRKLSRQLFPVPSMAEAEESARYVLKTLRQETVGKTPDEQRSYVFGTLRSGVSPFTFEQMVVQCFSEMGFLQTEAPQFKRDGGIDGAILYDGAKILLQTKRYGSGEARFLVKHLRDFIDVVTRHRQQEKAIGGFFIHTGRSGLEAKGIVEATQGLITMFSGNTLLDLLLKPNG